MVLCKSIFDESNPALYHKQVVVFMDTVSLH